MLFMMYINIQKGNTLKFSDMITEKTKITNPSKDEQYGTIEVDGMTIFFTGDSDFDTEFNIDGKTVNVSYNEMIRIVETLSKVYKKRRW